MEHPRASKAKITWLRKLQHQKFRKELGLFLAEGDKLVRDFLSGPLEVAEVYCKPDWPSVDLAAKRCPVFLLDDKELRQASSLSTPNQVIAVIRIPSLPSLDAFSPEGLVLALDAIRDPGNLGTIIRTADWFGVHTILASPDCVETWNPKVVQATMGALNRVSVIPADLPGLFRELPTAAPVLGTFMDAPSLYTSVLPRDLILVIGNESQGISQEVSDGLSARIGIPACHQGHGESLNAAISAAIFCAEYRRRHPF